MLHKQVDKKVLHSGMPVGTPTQLDVGERELCPQELS